MSHVCVDVSAARRCIRVRRARGGVPPPRAPRGRRAGLHRSRGLALGPRSRGGPDGLPLDRSRIVHRLHAQRRARGLARADRPCPAGRDQARAPGASAHLRGGRDVSRPVAPPSGFPPPGSATLGGRRIVLAPLAEAIADRYFAEFPEDLERYGDAALPLEPHDRSYCRQWALLDADGLADLRREIAWLRDILRARGFPLEHLARNLELA